MLGLSALTVVYFSTSRARPSWWILVAVPLALAAVATRFGAPVPLAVGVIVILLWRRRSVMQNPVPVIVAGALAGAGTLALLLVPGLTGSSGSPLSSIRTLQAENDLPLWQSVPDYVRQADSIVGGYVGLFFLAGLALAALFAWREREHWHTWGFLMWWAGLTAVALGIVLHGEYRYLTPVYPIAWIIAGWGLAEFSRRISREVVLVFAVLFGLLLPLNAAAHADFAVDALGDRFGDLRVVSRDIERVHAYEECGVITSYIPQVAWYSECVTRRFEATPVFTSPFFAGERADYVLWVTGGKRQPDDVGFANYLAETTGVVFESGEPNTGTLQYAVVYEVR